MRPKAPSWLTGSEAIFVGDKQKSSEVHIPPSSVNGLGSGSRSSALSFQRRPEALTPTTPSRNFRHSMASQIPFAMRKLKLHSSRPRASSRATMASMASTTTACYEESAYRMHFDSQSSEFDVASQASRPVSRWSSSTEGGTISPKKTGHRKSKTNSIFTRRPESQNSMASSHRTSVSRNSISVLGRHKKRASKSKLAEVTDYDPTTFRTHRMRPKISGPGGHEALYQEYDDLFDDTLDVLEDIPDEELVPEMSPSDISEEASTESSRKGSEAGSFLFLCGNDSRSDHQASPSLPKISSLSPLRAEFSIPGNDKLGQAEEGNQDGFSRARESLRSLRRTGTATPPYSKPGSYSELYSASAAAANFTTTTTGSTGKMATALSSPPTPPPKIDGDEIHQFVPPRLVEALAQHETANNYGNIKRNSAEMRVISLTLPASTEALDSTRSTEPSAHLEASSPTSIYEEEEGDEGPFAPLAQQHHQPHIHTTNTTTNTTCRLQSSPDGLGISNIPPPIPTQSVLRYTQLISTPTSILNYHHSAQHSDPGQTTPELEKDEGDSFGSHTPEEADLEHKMRSDTVTSCLFEEVDGGVAPLFFAKNTNIMTNNNKKTLKIDSSVGGGRTVGSVPNSAPLVRSAAIRASGQYTSRRTISGVNNFNIHELESPPSKVIAPTDPTSPTAADNASVKSPVEPRMVSSVYDFSDLGFIPACEPWTPQSPDSKKNFDCLAAFMVEEKQVVDDDQKSCSDCESCASEVLDSMKEVVARPMTEIFNPSAWQYYDFNFCPPEEVVGDATVAETESVETKVEETPEEKEAAKKERDLSYLRAFRLFLKRSPAADAYIQRNVRFEGLQTQRFRAHVRSLPVPVGKGNKKSPKGLSAADIQHQIRDDIMGSLWSLMAYRWLNFGKIIISPAHELLLAASYKRLNRRVKEKKDKRASELLQGARFSRSDVHPDASLGRRRVLDLGGEPVADWGWHCAYDYPRAKVYTVTLRAPKSTEEDSSSSESDNEGSSKGGAKREEDTPRGPPNHRHVSVKTFWTLPFPSNHFDVISARTLYASLTNNCHTSSLSGRFIDEYDLVMEEIMRVLKPGGYFEYNLVDCEILNGSSSSREFAGTLAMNLADKNHDPFPARRFISRLHKAGFKNDDIKRGWVFAPLAPSSPKPKPLPKDNIVSPISAPKSQLPGLPDMVMEEIKADMAKKMGKWEEEKAVPTGCTDAVASISGLFGGWALERMAKLVGMNSMEVATALGEVVRDEVGEGRRAGLKTLVGWARKPAL